MHRATRLVINRPTVIYDVQGAETVIIDLATGHYFRLDGASTRLWERFDTAVSPEDLLATCTDPGALEPVLDGIVADLTDHALIRAATDTEVGDDLTSDWAFDGFVLEQFTDLEDILGLDPIHEVDPDRGWPHVSAP